MILTTPTAATTDAGIFFPAAQCQAREIPKPQCQVPRPRRQCRAPDSNAEYRRLPGNAERGIRHLERGYIHTQTDSHPTCKRPTRHQASNLVYM